MIYRNAYIENQKQLSDITTEGGRIVRIAPSDQTATKNANETVDLGGKLVLPPFVDSHLHLDTTHTVDPAESRGTLWSGIAFWSSYRDTVTKKSVKENAKKAVLSAVLRGVQHIRTHVDICPARLTAMEALLELKDELKKIVGLQIVAFPQEGILSYPGNKERIETALKMGADAIGGVPHYEYTREYAAESMKYAVDLAVKTGKLIDVHCDETDDDSSRGLESLAAFALEAGIGDRVTASHTTAAGSYSDAYMNRLMRVLVKSKINFVANPLVNLHLQGRFDTFPKRRGLTRVRELTEAGLNVSFGQDDVKDPWYPMGNGDMINVVHTGLHACHMTAYDDILSSYKFVTVNGAKTLNLRGYGVAEGNPADFIVLNCADFYEAVSERAEVLYSIRNGEIIASATPCRRTLKAAGLF
ncbi:cytosine deaminase [Clostridia bacterium]|nr:cytosine deaminase [Clostridia bacterium]